MTRRIRRGAIAAAAAVLATTAMLVPATRADAIPMCRIGYQCSYNFFDSSEHTNRVGWRMEWCDGTSDSEGTISPYMEFLSVKCNDGL